VQSRHRRLEHCAFHPVEPGRTVKIAGWTIYGVEVPHGRAEFPTMAWRIEEDQAAVVYASDVARPVGALRSLSDDALALIVDGATNGPRLPRLTSFIAVAASIEAATT
jgi:hypothetical protein